MHPMTVADTVGPRGRTAPGDSSGGSSRIPDPKGPGDSCKGRNPKLRPRSPKRALTFLFKIITRIKLLFSNYLGRYSYSFRARQELISVTVTVLWVRREYVFTVTVRYSYIKNGLRNYFPKITVTVT